MTLSVSSSRKFIAAIAEYGWFSFELDATSTPKIVSPARRFGMGIFPLTTGKFNVVLTMTIFALLLEVLVLGMSCFYYSHVWTNYNDRFRNHCQVIECNLRALIILRTDFTVPRMNVDFKGS